MAFFRVFSVYWEPVSGYGYRILGTGFDSFRILGTNRSNFAFPKWYSLDRTLFLAFAVEMLASGKSFTSFIKH